MKFQNPSFKILLNGRTDRQAESNMLPTFSKLEAIMTFEPLPGKTNKIGCAPSNAQISLGNLPFLSVLTLPTMGSS